MQAVREQYLTFLAKQSGELNPRGIPQTARSVTLPLNRVYVSLTAERETERVELNRDMWDNASQGDVLRRLQPPHDQASRVVERVSEKVDLPRAITTAYRAVILGDPGAGKTTLIRFLATRFAEAYLNKQARVVDDEGNDYGDTRLPILLRVADYADAFRKNRNLSLREFLAMPFGNIGIALDDLTALFEDHIHRGVAFVLLDGLDEVANGGDRIEIARQIEAFTSGVANGCRVLVTSRIAGYREAQLAAGFMQYTLRDMDREQIEKFLRRWCVAVERFHSADADDATIAERGNAESDAILREVDRNEGVRRLAKNPLLLTILALIHRNGARLPERRIELYEIASKTLLEDWRLAQAGGEARIVKEHEALELLGPLAYWMHENEPTGLMAERDVKAKLCEFLGEARGRKPKDAEIQAGVEDFLRRVREHSGLFVERAPGKYGFMHLTFEEYFAARHITGDFLTAASRIYPYRHKPRWQEPIRLAIAYERPKNAAHLLRTAILTQGDAARAAGYEPSEYKDILHRDLLLAARCIGDCDGVEATLAHDIAQRLIAILLQKDETADYEPLRKQVREILPSLAGGEVGTEIAGSLSTAFMEGNWELQRELAPQLGQLGQTTQETLTALLQAMKDAEEYVRGGAASALGQLGQATPEVLAALLEAIKDTDNYVRGKAAEALSQLGQATPEVLATLLTDLKDIHEEVRGSAAAALGQLGQATPEILAALLETMKDTNSNVRGSAMAALGRLGQATPEILAVLLDAMQDTDDYVRGYAAAILGQLGQATPEVLAVLLKALQDTGTLMRANATAALGEIGQVTPGILAALLKMMQDTEWNVRKSAALALGQLGQATPEIIAALLQGMKDNDKAVRASVALALGQLGQATPEVIAALLQAMKDVEEYARGSAASALGQLGQATPEILTALLQAIKDTEWNVRDRAWLALWNMTEKRESETLTPDPSLGTTE